MMEPTSTQALVLPSLEALNIFTEQCLRFAFKTKYTSVKNDFHVPFFINDYRIIFLTSYKP